MTIVLDKNSTHEERQKKLLELHNQRQFKRYNAKKKMVSETFGQVAFDESKTADVIYKELRDEWD